MKRCIPTILFLAVAVIGFAEVSYARDLGTDETVITTHHGGRGWQHGGGHRGGWRR